MLKFFWSIIKLSLFSLLVLVIGSLVSWNGKTISDHVKIQSSFLKRMQDRAVSVVSDARKGAERKVASVKEKAGNTADNIYNSERLKLKALIQELNSSKPPQAKNKLN